MTDSGEDIQTAQGSADNGPHRTGTAPDWEATAKIIRASSAARLAETRGGRKRRRVGIVHMVMMAGVAVLLLGALAGAFSRLLLPMMKNWKRDQEMAVAAKEHGLAESGEDVGMPAEKISRDASTAPRAVGKTPDPLMEHAGTPARPRLETPTDAAPHEADKPLQLVPDRQSSSAPTPRELAALQAIAPAGAPPRPWAAIVVTEVGGNPALARTIVETLPGTVAIGVSPLGKASRDLAEMSRDKGHEVWAGVPMQPLSYPRNDPGPHTIKLDASQEQNASNLAWALAQTPGAVGAYNIMGSAVTRDEAVMTGVLRQLKAGNLLFLDARAAVDTVSRDLGEKLDLPVAVNDRYIQATPSVADIAVLATQARQRGFAIAFVEASPRTVKTVQALIAGFEAEGISLVPPSIIARYSHKRAVAAR